MSETEVAQFFEEILFNFVVLNESKCFDNFDYAFSIFCDTFLVKLFPELGDESSKGKYIAVICGCACHLNSQSLFQKSPFCSTAPLWPFCGIFLSRKRLYS